ncbi:MAG TPA: Rrf2 family transcriptional regulator [bacterium]|nr:Rrf2 family transcriptional regulator [bacterium]
MKISRKGEYALRAMTMLSLHHGRGLLRAREIAARQAIPERFLERILLDLKKAGILLSVRGRNGGYALARPPRLITLARVIRIIDGPLAPIGCASDWARLECPAQAGCGLYRVMRRVRNAIAGILEKTTFADIRATARRPSAGRGGTVGRGCAG